MNAVAIAKIIVILVSLAANNPQIQGWGAEAISKLPDLTPEKRKKYIDQITEMQQLVTKIE